MPNSRPPQGQAYLAVGDRSADVQRWILGEEILKRDLKFELVGQLEQITLNFIRGIKRVTVRSVHTKSPNRWANGPGQCYRGSGGSRAAAEKKIGEKRVEESVEIVALLQSL